MFSISSISFRRLLTILIGFFLIGFLGLSYCLGVSYGDDRTQPGVIKMLAMAGEGSLGILAKDPAFAQKLNDTVTKLDSILTQVDSGQGSVGALFKDKALYDHADQVMKDSSDLIQAIRKDPKKYLTIHLKIF